MCVSLVTGGLNRSVFARAFHHLRFNVRSRPLFNNRLLPPSSILLERVEPFKSSFAPSPSCVLLGFPKVNVVSLQKRFYASNKDPECQEEKPSLFQRFKAMYRDYWYVLVPVHIVTSCFWFGIFFYMAQSGVDIAALLEAINLHDSAIGQKIKEGASSTAGYLAIAYALYKIATPLRYSLTLGGTTISINYLKKWGYIKPIPKKAEVMKLIEDKRESFREQKAHMKERVINKFTQKEKK